MEHLISHCITDRQVEVLKAVIEHGSCRKAAIAIGCGKSSVIEIINKIKKRAASVGVAPEKDLYYPLPKGQVITGTSTLQRSPEGNLQWIKTKADAQSQLDMMREAVDAMVSDLPRVDLRADVTGGNDDLMAVYPIGDAHIGMRAWHEECGDDWDLSIAESVFVNLFDRLVKTAPKCKRAVVIDLGDWMHADNMSGTTERSGHQLDVDGRFGKMAYVAVKILRRIIESSLEHHEFVDVICNIGNHNDTSSQLVSIGLMNIYENEPRIKIHPYAKPFHYITHGKVLIGTHHGHTCKADKLPLVMATDMAKEWGESIYRYWHVGHIHHDTVKEYQGVKVESFRTLAGKDAYSTWNGYRSGQDSKCIVYHKEHGEVERHTVNIGMVK